MPTIIFGRGDSGADKFTEALRMGMATAQDRREADLREKQYQKELQLAEMQLQSADAEQELGSMLAHAMGSDPLQLMPGEEMPGGPAGIDKTLNMLALQGVGQSPGDRASLSFLVNRFPQAVGLLGRLTGDARTRFLKDIQGVAASTMAAEQTDDFLARALSAENTFLPPGWTEQAASDIQSGIRTLDRVESEYVSLRDDFAAQQQIADRNATQMAQVEQMWTNSGAGHAYVDESTESDYWKLKAEYEATGRVDRNLLRSVMGALMGENVEMPAPPKTIEEMGPPSFPTGYKDPWTSEASGGEQMAVTTPSQAADSEQSPSIAGDATYTTDTPTQKALDLYEIGMQQLPDILNSEDPEALKKFAEDNNLSPDQLRVLIEKVVQSLAVREAYPQHEHGRYELPPDQDSKKDSSTQSIGDFAKKQGQGN